MNHAPAVIFTVKVYTGFDVSETDLDTMADELRRDLDYAVGKLPITFHAEVEES